MNEATWQRLFGWQHAFDHPAVPWLVGGVLLVLVLATLLVAVLATTGKIGAATRKELRQRIGSWWLLAPLMLGPVLLGAAWTFAAVLLLSLGCYREFARATGLFREHLTSALVVLEFPDNAEDDLATQISRIQRSLALQRPPRCVKTPHHHAAASYSPALLAVTSNDVRDHSRSSVASVAAASSWLSSSLSS